MVLNLYFHFISIRSWSNMLTFVYYGKTLLGEGCAKSYIKMSSQFALTLELKKKFKITMQNT